MKSGRFKKEKCIPRDRERCCSHCAQQNHAQQAPLARLCVLSCVLKLAAPSRQYPIYDHCFFQVQTRQRLYGDRHPNSLVQKYGSVEGRQYLRRCSWGCTLRRTNHRHHSRSNVPDKTHTHTHAHETKYTRYSRHQPQDTKNKHAHTQSLCHD